MGNRSEVNMLTKASDEFKRDFLLRFTRELIRNSVESEFLELETILEKKEKPTIQEIKEKIKERENPVLIKQRLSNPFPSMKKKPSIPVLNIPETKLPENLQYLKPIPTKLEMDLGKLNPLIKDPLVNSIECLGTDEPVVVRGRMGVKKTGIVLDKEEIDQIINKFSEEAKIPIHEGILRMAKGRLVLSAIVSKVIGSKFIIKKMAYQYPSLKRPNAR